MTIKQRLNIVGVNVRWFQLAKNPPMTQDHLAIQLQLLDWKIDRFGVSKIERGERQVTDIGVKKLSIALGVPIVSLFEE